MTGSVAQLEAAPRTGPRPLAVLLGVTGELLITVGLLLGLFIAWQLWWTDVVGERAQARIVAELPWPEPPPVDLADPPTERTSQAPVLQEPAYATTFATLQVPRWGATPSPISEGTGKRDVLDRLGIGHYAGTAMPGGIGNLALAGHRTTYGKPFNRVDELQPGDALVVRTESTWYVYRVTGTEIVSPSAIEVIEPVPGAPDATPTIAQLTMTTCHPTFSGRERYVVHASLDVWLPVDQGTPSALDMVVPIDGGS